MPFPLILLLGFAGVGIAAAASAAKASASPSPSPSRGPIRLALVGTGDPLIDRLQSEFSAAEKRADAVREQREKDARAEVNRYADAVQSIPVVGYVLGPFARYLWLGGLETGKKIAAAFYKDPQWNSPANKDRARSLMLATVNLGFSPYAPTGGADDDFASWGARLEGELFKVRELFASRPDVAAAWSAARGWIASNPEHKAVKDLHSIEAWPFSPDARNPKKVAAIATVFAAMRGKDTAAARASALDWYQSAIKTDLRLWDNFQWMLGAAIEHADRVTR